MFGRLKRLIYKKGYRPKRGSVFYSPSLSYIYAFIDAWKEEKL